MLANYFTKPLQGAKFHAFWDRIVGIPEKVSGLKPLGHTPKKELKFKESEESISVPGKRHDVSPCIIIHDYIGGI